MTGFSDFVAESKRRRVMRALLGWGIAAFAVLQVYEPVMHGLHLPGWTLSFVVVVLGLGFPVTALLAWVFDLTPGGIERTRPAAEPEDGPGAPARSRGVRLALLLGVAAAVPGLLYFLAWPRTGRGPAGEPTGSPAASASPSIAVMPFADLSPQHDQEYFSEGLSEEILNALARVEGLRVAGHASSFSLKDKREDLAGIDRKLGVGAVLEGSVRRDGQRVRITARVSDVGSGSQLWSQNYDRELTDVFAVQDEIAAAVVATLKVRLLPGKEPSTQAYRTSNPEVYSLDLVGHRFFARESKDGMRRAVEAFERAVALAPDLAEASATRGKARSWISWDWAGARADLERAVRLSPGDALVQQQYAALLASLGRLPDAIGAARRSSIPCGGTPGTSSATGTAWTGSLARRGGRWTGRWSSTRIRRLRR